MRPYATNTAQDAEVGLEAGIEQQRDHAGPGRSFEQM